MRGSLSVRIATLLLIASLAVGADTGNLKLDVLGKDGAGAKNPAHLMGADGKEVGANAERRRGETFPKSWPR